MSAKKYKLEIKIGYTFYHEGKEYIIEVKDTTEARNIFYQLIK